MDLLPGHIFCCALHSAVSRRHVDRIFPDGINGFHQLTVLVKIRQAAVLHLFDGREHPLLHGQENLTGVLILELAPPHGLARSAFREDVLHLLARHALKLFGGKLLFVQRPDEHEIGQLLDAGFMAGFRTTEQTPFDIEMRFTMNKLLSCRYNMDTNRVEARFEDGTTLAIDCIAVEDEYGNSPAQRAELDWLLYNKPLEYAQMVLGGRMERYLSLGCDHGRLED